MKIKITIILINILFISIESFACLVASQERLIPIGTNEGCLIAIEVISFRDGSPKDYKPIWEYQLKLKGYNHDYSDFLISDLDSLTNLKESELETILQDQFKKALKICTKLSNFLPLELQTLKFCDFQKKCSEIELIETENAIGIKEIGKKTIHPIQFLSKDYSGKMGKKYLEYIDFYYSDAVGKDLQISSVRKYKNEEYELIIFHLGTGQEFNNPDTNEFPTKKEYSPKKKIENGIFIEPILHHGKGFDYYIFLK